MNGDLQRNPNKKRENREKDQENKEMRSLNIKYE